jgi:hypothetical protein
MSDTVNAERPSAALRTSLWVAQGLLFFSYSSIGVMKLLMPIQKLAQTIPWAAQVPEIFVRAIGCIDLAGGLGILLPALTRIKPDLTVAAARGCTVLQTCAIIFHLARGEAMLLPTNLVLMALSTFVLWGRVRRAPISPRG